MPKITKELLLSLGISERAAEAAMEKVVLLDAKPRFYRVKATDARVAKLAADNPDLQFEAGSYKRKPKAVPEATQLPF
jgi:hypothetical protein